MLSGRGFALALALSALGCASKGSPSATTGGGGAHGSTSSSSTTSSSSGGGATATSSATTASSASGSGGATGAGGGDAGSQGGSDAGATDAGKPGKGLPLGAGCGFDAAPDAGTKTCATGLACCQPCPMQQCDSVCVVACTAQQTGCIDGCLPQILNRR